MAWMGKSARLVRVVVYLLLEEDAPVEFSAAILNEYWKDRAGSVKNVGRSTLPRDGRAVARLLSLMARKGALMITDEGRNGRRYMVDSRGFKALQVEVCS